MGKTRATTDKGGPAVIVIRYAKELAQTCKNSVIKNMSIHHNYNGAVSGIACGLEVIEGAWPHKKGVAILTFDTMDDAVRWEHSTPEIKQKDWLGGVDIIAVPMKQVPTKDAHFVQIIDMDIMDLQLYKTEYQDPARQHIEDSGATAGVVATDPGQIKKLRGQWDPRYVVLNCWSSKEQFEAAYCAEAYQPLKEKRMMYANCDACIFALEPVFDRRR